MKKRILACSESSLTATGFGNYYKEVLSRLHRTGKYEICELASYQYPEEYDAIASVPWKMIPNMPPRNDQQQRDIYDSDPLNQFGQWKFERACLEFKPDIVFDIRDPWMFEHQQRSPFRRFFHWAIMPTVDSIPQDEQWIESFASADGVFTYTDWGLEVLRQSGNGRIKLISSAPPAADYDVFTPVLDKQAHKRELNIAEDCLIVGTVMRNQRRKLYPDLIEAFAQFLKTAPEALSRRAYLYLHTRWPDIGWDIPRLIKEAGISNRVIMTYICKNCNGAFPSFFQGARTYCRGCKQQTAFLSDSDKGVSREVLAKFINLFDVYVQYSYCEGFGMPMVEAAACGVPVMAVDYSAMEDVTRKINGFPLPVKTWSRDGDTHRKIAVPNQEAFVSQLQELFSLPSFQRKNLGRKARSGAMTHYSYDKTAKAWEDHFDSVQVRDHATTWNSPAQMVNPQFALPENMSNVQLVNWGLQNVAGRPDLINSYLALRMIRDLNNEVTIAHTGGMYFNEMSHIGTQNRVEPYPRDRALDDMLNLAANHNRWEEIRTGKAK
jgi:glycosyltransferase involved in cell wall biosynthesis